MSIYHFIANSPLGSWQRGGCDRKHNYFKTICFAEGIKVQTHFLIVELLKKYVMKASNKLPDTRVVSISISLFEIDMTIEGVYSCVIVMVFIVEWVVAEVYPDMFQMSVFFN